MKMAASFTARIVGHFDHKAEVAEITSQPGDRCMVCREFGEEGVRASMIGQGARAVDIGRLGGGGCDGRRGWRRGR
jgi:hypothetical protein